MRRPGHRLHCCQMVTELDDGLCNGLIPDEELIVVSPRTQLLLVEGPLQPADFLLMANQLVHILA